MPKISHKKLGIDAELKDFSQAQYETYQTMLLEMTKNQTAAAVGNGAVVRCAIKSGFLFGVLETEIPNMKPSAVIWLTKKIHEHVVEVTKVPADEDPN